MIDLILTDKKLLIIKGDFLREISSKIEEEKKKFEKDKCNLITLNLSFEFEK